MSFQLFLPLGEFELYEIPAEILFEPSAAVLDLTRHHPYTWRDKKKNKASSERQRDSHSAA